MALSKDRDTVEVDSPLASARTHTAKAGSVFYKGQLVRSILTENGVAAPGAASTGSIGAGIATKSFSAVAGDEITVKTGIFWFDNSSSSDEFTKGDIGDLAYMVDDERVAKTSSGGARSIAGRVHDVKSGSAGQAGYGVAVLVDPTLVQSGSAV